jgi:hypothetical protein
MGGDAATRDDVTDGGAFAGMRIPYLDFYVVTVGDNIASLSVVTGEAAEDDLVAGPGRDVASDEVGARVASPAGVPSRGEITDAEVRRISF